MVIPMHVQQCRLCFAEANGDYLAKDDIVRRSANDLGDPAVECCQCIGKNGCTGFQCIEFCGGETILGCIAYTAGKCIGQTLVVRAERVERKEPALQKNVV